MDTLNENQTDSLTVLINKITEPEPVQPAPVAEPITETVVASTKSKTVKLKKYHSPRTTKGSNKCLLPKCANFASVRGLCLSCYPIAARLIKEGKTTWAKLEKSKKCLPSAIHRRKSKTDWFLGKE